MTGGINVGALLPYWPLLGLLTPLLVEILAGPHLRARREVRR